MKIACTGPAQRLEELRIKISSANEIQLVEFSTPEEMSQAPANLYIDLGYDLRVSWDRYPSLSAPLLLSSARLHLKRHLQQHPLPHQETVIGFAASPGCLNRQIWELTMVKGQDESIHSIIERCGVKGKWVEDFPGLLSPRVIAMIINEAYLTFQEGTASRKDIDIAMKMGTNYPYGPFEWADKLGKDEVVAILDALMQETGDPRYSVSRLLRQESLNTL